jgi:hypothetical protein
MPAPEKLDVTQPGDTFAGADLQAGIDQLKAMAEGLDQFKDDPAASVEDIQAIGRTQAELRSKAASLNVAQVDLLVGEVKITAEHINAAVVYSDGVIAKIADWRKRIHKIGTLLVFLAVIPSGSGNEILQAARALKTALEA